VYDIVYTGTPPVNQFFRLENSNTGVQQGLTVRIAYPSALSRSIVKNEEVVEMNQWSDMYKNYGPVRQDFCGENRYTAVDNTLEFYIDGGCELQIQERDAIQTKVRMEWSLNDFYAKGGTTTFVDRLAASLGIHASTIKIVGVYTGSLIVDYFIYQASGADATTLAAVQEQQVAMLASGQVDLGAPILDWEQNQETIVNDGILTAQGYGNIIITPTATNNGGVSTRVEPEGYVHVDTTQVMNLEPEDHIVFKPDISIVNEDQYSKNPDYKEEQESNAERSIVLVAVIVFVLIAFGVGIRYVVNWARKQTIDEVAIQKIKEQKVEDTEMRNLETEDNLGGTLNTMQYNSQHKMLGIKQYETQYDPTGDMGIFQGSDIVPDWEMKVNQADTGTTQNRIRHTPSPILAEDRQIEITEDSEDAPTPPTKA
jgi:hypothetical protein